MGFAAIAGFGMQTPAVSLEYQVKAAYIYNFVSFTEWPPAAFSGADSPLRICVAGTNPFGTVLETTVKGENAHGHPIVVDLLPEGEGAARCHVLFAGRADAQSVEILRAIGKAPVLTVGESDQFLKAGGLVGFVMEDGHVRFDVNRQLAESRGLKLSSRMLRVARSVR